MAGQMEKNNSTAQNTMEGLAAERLKADKGEGAGDNQKEYDESWMTSNASGGLELMGVQSRGEGPTERQSSINTEPLTLDGDAMHDAKVLSCYHLLATHLWLGHMSVHLAKFFLWMQLGVRAVLNDTHIGIHTTQHLTGSKWSSKESEDQDNNHFSHSDFRVLESVHL
jgi:hypothetical protein